MNRDRTRTEGWGRQVIPRVADRLRKLCRRHRELRALCKHIRADGVASREFVVAYYRSGISYGLRAQLLNVLFDLGKSRSGEQLSQRVVRNLVTLYQYHPKRPLELWSTTMTKDDVPKGLFGLVALRRGAPARIVGQLAKRYIEVSAADAWALKPFYVAALITPECVECMLAGRLAPYRIARYITDVPEPFRLHNALVLLSVTLTTPRQGGRLQDKLLVAMTDYLGIARLSLIEATLAADILALRELAVANPPARPSDFLRLGEHKMDRRELKEERRRLGQQLFQLSLMTPEKSDAWVSKNGRFFMESGYTTGMLFNAQRLVARRYTKFRSYYEALDDDRLWALVVAHYSKWPSFLPHLKRARKSAPELFQGIQIRSIANILFHVWRQERKGHERARLLPPVARYALGEREPQRRKNQGPPKFARRTDTKARPRKVPPLLDELLPSA